jgi:hypothetical protein
VRDVFDLRASANLTAPLVPISFPELSENIHKGATSLLPLRFSEVRDVFALSASHNLTAPLVKILLSERCENEMKQKAYYS